MASILVLGPTVFSKGKENLDINEIQSPNGRRKAFEERGFARTMGVSDPGRVVCWPNANVLLEAGMWFCLRARKVS